MTPIGDLWFKVAYTGDKVENDELLANEPLLARRFIIKKMLDLAPDFEVRQASFQEPKYAWGLLRGNSLPKTREFLFRPEDAVIKVQMLYRPRVSSETTDTYRMRLRGECEHSCIDRPWEFMANDEPVFEAPPRDPSWPVGTVIDPFSVAFGSVPARFFPWMLSVMRARSFELLRVFVPEPSDNWDALRVERHLRMHDVDMLCVELNSQRNALDSLEKVRASLELENQKLSGIVEALQPPVRRSRIGQPISDSTGGPEQSVSRPGRRRLPRSSPA